jgi:hypothetical protein
VPFDRTWFVLLDNSYSTWTSKAVTVTFTLNSNGQTGSDENPAGIPISIWLFLGLIALAIVGVIVYANNESRKRRNQYATILPTKIMQVGKSTSLSIQILF